MHSTRRFLFIGLMPVSFCLSMHAFAQGTGISDKNLDASLVNQVKQFLDHFIDPQKTPEQQAALFTPDVEYYGRTQVSRAEIIRDIKYFTRRWPTRFYRLTSIGRITPDPESDRVFVSYEINYRVANSDKAATGKAHYGAVIANLNSSPKIEWIREEIIN